MMKKIIISGATGAIGIALINYALRKNMEILAICHKNSKRIAWLPKALQLHILELDAEEYSTFVLDSERMDDLGKYDCFFHLAWMGTTGEARNDTKLQTQNVQFTLDAVKLASGLGCKCFLGVGSQAEYGRINGMMYSKAPAFPENGYGIAKLCAGQMSRVQCKQLNIRHIWVRALSVYGPGDREGSLVMSAIINFLNAREMKFTSGTQKWDYLYSEDAARILLGLAEYGEDGHIYCMGAGENHLLKEYIHQIYREINGKDIPDKQLGIGGLAYEENQVMNLQADISEWPLELKSEFEKQPMYTFNEGIRKTINWVKHFESLKPLLAVHE